MRTYYEVLEVSPTASADEIRSAYRRLIRKWHPDLNPQNDGEATERSKVILEAYETLKDPRRRAAYDEALSAPRGSGASATDWYRSSTAEGRASVAESEHMVGQSIEDLLNEAAKTVWKGSRAYREEEAGFGSTLAVGFCAWLTLLLLIVPPAGIAIYFAVKNTFFPRGRFVGIGTVLGGMAAWLIIVGVCLGTFSALANGAAQSSSASTYSSIASTNESPVEAPQTVATDSEESTPVSTGTSASSSISSSEDLIDATMGGDSAKVKTLIASGSDPNIRGGDLDAPPLHLACAKGRLDIAEVLLAGGAEIEGTGAHGETPLYISALFGRTRVAKYLLHRGAQIDAKGVKGRTALFAAAANGKTETLRFLLDHGANLNIGDDQGVTPLHCAAGEGHADAVITLLRRGAYKDARDEIFGNTAADAADEKGHSDVADLIRRFSNDTPLNRKPTVRQANPATSSETSGRVPVSPEATLTKPKAGKLPKSEGAPEAHGKVDNFGEIG